MSQTAESAGIREGESCRPSLAAAWLAVAVALSACGSGNGGEPPPDTTVRSTPVAAIEIRPRDLSRSVSLSATVEPRVVVRLAARTPGAVEEVLVEEGAAVVAGQVLARLDMSEALAELARARAQEHSARLDYQRATDLRRRGMLSVAQHEAARVALQVAESEQALWRTRVEFGRISSPLDAIVTARQIELGEAVQEHATLFELASLDDLVVRFGVSELDVVHLGAGQKMRLSLDALPELELHGTVRRIAPVANATSRLVTVEVALQSDARLRGVRPGFLARTRIELDPRPDALGVPAHAVGRNDASGGPDGSGFVFVIENGVLTRRTVMTGVTRGEWTEILGGLQAGEQVLASNPIEMRDGQPVRVVEMRP
ncbi:MAG: efflux RND transporter periplasmic adaptor subunit [Rhodocyclaceae bacterium]|jgi:RND family efflux transporter MFP subunit|nr:efflux RND transporter periplasmic adaptor subunit [Rhodocyclaceae bacterium]